MKPLLPSSDGFWILSGAFRDAGDATFSLIRTGGYTGLAVLPCVFLYFRCVELALKSVLVHHGVVDQEIARSLGHRLSALLTRVETFAALSRLGITAIEELSSSTVVRGRSSSRKLVTASKCSVRLSLVAIFSLIAVSISDAAPPPLQAATPTAPRFNWEQIANTAEFKALPADKQLTVLKNYATELCDYLKSVPGSHSDAVDAQINAFIERETSRIVKAETDRLLPTPPPAISSVRRHVSDHFVFYSSLCGALITLAILYVIGWRRAWRAVVNSPMIVIIFFVCLLLITPWRESDGRTRRASGYSLLFIAPTTRSEIDVTRYAVQVFAGAAVFAAIYLTRRLWRH